MKTGAESPNDPVVFQVAKGPSPTGLFLAAASLVLAAVIFTKNTSFK